MLLPLPEYAFEGRDGRPTLRELQLATLPVYVVVFVGRADLPGLFPFLTRMGLSAYEKLFNLEGYGFASLRFAGADWIAGYFPYFYYGQATGIAATYYLRISGEPATKDRLMCPFPLSGPNIHEVRLVGEPPDTATYERLRDRDRQIMAALLAGRKRRPI